LRQAACRLAAGEFNVALFTSSIQLEHLLEIAHSRNLESQVREALQRDVAIASLGPVMMAALETLASRRHYSELPQDGRAGKSRRGIGRSHLSAKRAAQKAK
jgi:uroporphyrinogen-III synthase